MTLSSALIWFGVIAVLLFLVGGMLARRRHVSSRLDVPASPDSMQPLMDGAEAVNKIARTERLALAVVAERSGDATNWFACNIANIVGAWRKNEAGAFELTKDDTNPQSLYTQQGDLERYLTWACSVM